MADLNEVVTTVVRKQWDRANKVRIENEYGKPPAITFEIQTAITDDGVFTGATPKSLLTVAFDPSEVYPLINPLDDTVISADGGNHLALQAHIYSLFRYKTRQG